MTATTEEPTQDLADVSEGRKVKIVKVNGEEVVGKVKVSSAVGYLIMTKGRSIGTLVETHEIRTVEAIDHDDDLKATTMKPVKESTVRRHLLNAHGWTLTQVNALSDEDALAKHESLHTDTSDWGHTHSE